MIADLLLRHRFNGRYQMQASRLFEKNDKEAFKCFDGIIDNTFNVT